MGTVWGIGKLLPNIWGVLVSSKPTAIVYIDGLNMYHQKLRYHPQAKWLNLLSLAEMLVPTHEIKLVRYFTAEVLPGVTDQHAPKRQKEYWRALETLGDRITIHLGRMEARNRHYLAVPRAYDETGKPIRSKVKKTEEKGSDVSLAAHMVFDAATREADLFVLVSTDSDFEPAIRIVQERLGLPVGFISPHDKPSDTILECKPLFTKILRRAALEACTFPDVMQDSRGLITKPESWSLK